MSQIHMDKHHYFMQQEKIELISFQGINKIILNRYIKHGADVTHLDTLSC